MSVIKMLSSPHINYSFMQLDHSIRIDPFACGLKGKSVVLVPQKKKPNSECNNGKSTIFGYGRREY